MLGRTTKNAAAAAAVALAAVADAVSYTCTATSPCTAIDCGPGVDCTIGCYYAGCLGLELRAWGAGSVQLWNQAAVFGFQGKVQATSGKDVQVICNENWGCAAAELEVADHATLTVVCSTGSCVSLQMTCFYGSTCNQRDVGSNSCGNCYTTVYSGATHDLDWASNLMTTATTTSDHAAIIDTFAATTKKPFGFGLHMLPGFWPEMGSWAGYSKVTMNTAYQVTEIDLGQGQFVDLRGEVDLTKLPANLKELYITQNSLTGTLDLTALPSKLKILHAWSNQLTGTFDLTQLNSKLQELDLWNNDFDETTGFLDFDQLPASITRVAIDAEVKCEPSTCPSGYEPAARVTYLCTSAADCRADCQCAPAGSALAAGGAAEDEGEDDEDAPWLVAGLAGGAALLGLVAAGACVVRRRRKQRAEARDNEAQLSVPKGVPRMRTHSVSGSGRGAEEGKDEAAAEEEVEVAVAAAGADLTAEPAVV